MHLFKIRIQRKQIQIFSDVSYNPPNDHSRFNSNQELYKSLPPYSRRNTPLLSRSYRLYIWGLFSGDQDERSRKLSVHMYRAPSICKLHVPISFIGICLCKGRAYSAYGILVLSVRSGIYVPPPPDVTSVVLAVAKSKSTEQSSS
jgi:hypothetical protein